LIHRFSQATTIQLLLCQLGDALPEGRVVVEDRDLLAGPMIGQVVAGHDADRIVAGLDAEHVGAPEFGQYRVARRR
jgi:hypothetical protein